MKVGLTIRIDESLKEVLKQIATINGRSITKQVEYWIRNDGTAKRAGKARQTEGVSR